MSDDPPRAPSDNSDPGLDDGAPPVDPPREGADDVIDDPDAVDALGDMLVAHLTRHPHAFDGDKRVAEEDDVVFVWLGGIGGAPPNAAPQLAAPFYMKHTQKQFELSDKAAEALNIDRGGGRFAVYSVEPPASDPAQGVPVLSPKSVWEPALWDWIQRHDLTTNVTPLDIWEAAVVRIAHAALVLGAQDVADPGATKFMVKDDSPPPPSEFTFPPRVRDVDEGAGDGGRRERARIHSPALVTIFSGNRLAGTPAWLSLAHYALVKFLKGPPGLKLPGVSDDDPDGSLFRVSFAHLLAQCWDWADYQPWIDFARWDLDSFDSFVVQTGIGGVLANRAGPDAGPDAGDGRSGDGRTNSFADALALPQISSDRGIAAQTHLVVQTQRARVDWGGLGDLPHVAPGCVCLRMVACRPLLGGIVPTSARVIAKVSRGCLFVVAWGPKTGRDPDVVTNFWEKGKVDALFQDTDDPALVAVAVCLASPTTAMVKWATAPGERPITAPEARRKFGLGWADSGFEHSHDVNTNVSTMVVPLPIRPAPHEAGEHILVGRVRVLRNMQWGDMQYVGVSATPDDDADHFVAVRALDAPSYQIGVANALIKSMEFNLRNMEITQT